MASNQKFEDEGPGEAKNHEEQSTESNTGDDRHNVGGVDTPPPTTDCSAGALAEGVVAPPEIEEAAEEKEDEACSDDDDDSSDDSSDGYIEDTLSDCNAGLECLTEEICPPAQQKEANMAVALRASSTVWYLREDGEANKLVEDEVPCGNEAVQSAAYFPLRASSMPTLPTLEESVEESDHVFDDLDTIEPSIPAISDSAICTTAYLAEDSLDSFHEAPKEDAIMLLQGESDSQAAKTTVHEARKEGSADGAMIEDEVLAPHPAENDETALTGSETQRSEEAITSLIGAQAQNQSADEESIFPAGSNDERSGGAMTGAQAQESTSDNDKDNEALNDNDAMNAQPVFVACGLEITEENLANHLVLNNVAMREGGPCDFSGILSQNNCVGQKRVTFHSSVPEPEDPQPSTSGKGKKKKSIKIRPCAASSDDTDSEDDMPRFIFWQQNYEHVLDELIKRLGKGKRVPCALSPPGTMFTPSSSEPDLEAALDAEPDTVPSSPCSDGADACETAETLSPSEIIEPSGAPESAEEEVTAAEVPPNADGPAAEELAALLIVQNQEDEYDGENEEEVEESEI